MPDLRPKLSFANVISLIALFIALGGSAYAIKLKTNSVKSKHIAPDAATGADVNEGTLGTVPSATNAVNASNATNAGNATTVGGVGANELQFGDGLDDAAAGYVDPGDIGGTLVFEGAVGIECDNTPTLLYTDFGPDGVNTDYWVDTSSGAFATWDIVGDEASANPVNLNTFDSIQVQIWGGGGTVALVMASVAWDAGQNRCALAFTTQENLEDGAVVLNGASAAERMRDPAAREQLPAGWTTLSGRSDR